MEGGVVPRPSESSFLRSIFRSYREFAFATHSELRRSRRPEVSLVNRYAVIIGYQVLAVRAMGYLLLLWSTVVLLGGFVTSLAKKDFWCLAAITLIQTAGVLTAFTDDKSAYLWESFPSFVLYLADLRKELLREWERSAAAFAIATSLLFVNTILSIVYTVVIYPVSAVYLYGLFLSPVLALTRIVQYDYGIGDADASKANLKPALNLLYCLAIFQGFFIWLGASFTVLEGLLVKVLSKHYELEGERGYNSVKRYIFEMRKRCYKDPQLAKGRNLITFAGGLLESESPKDFQYGAWMLDKLIVEHKQHLSKLEETQKQYLEEELTEEQKQRYLEKLEEWRLHFNLNWVSASSYNIFKRQIAGFRSSTQVLFQQMLDMLIEENDLKMKKPDESASSKNIIQTLLQKLGQRSTVNTRDRECIARILEYIADGIHLEQFPGEIQSISSLLETGQHTAGIDTQCRQLMLLGLCIFEKLASNEGNCRVISNTECLLSKIMAPVSSDLLHLIGHGVWRHLVMCSLKVIRRLVAAPKETGSKLRGEIASNRDAISSMQGILWCDTNTCDLELQKLALEILTQLLMDTSSTSWMGSQSKWSEMLLHIFTDGNKDNSMRELAGEALASVSLRSESHSIIILQINGVVHSLTEIMLRDENNTCRITAAKILEGLCIHYTENDDYHNKLQKPMIEVMPKVFREILRCGSKGKEKCIGTEAEVVDHSTQQNDIESQNGTPKGSERSNSTSSTQQNVEGPEDRKFWAALLSLIAKVIDNLSICPLDAISSQTLKEMVIMVQRNSQTTPNCLRILKLTSEMVISIMKHRSSYLQQDLVDLMESLSHASTLTLMKELDAFMLFSSDGDAETKPVRTLTSLVKEAKQLADRKIRDELPSTSYHYQENL